MQKIWIRRESRVILVHTRLTDEVCASAIAIPSCQADLFRLPLGHAMHLRGSVRL